MHRILLRVAAGAALALAGCPGGGGGTKTTPDLPDDKSPLARPIDLPAVPATIKTTSSDPMANHKAEAASPIYRKSRSCRPSEQAAGWP